MCKWALCSSFAHWEKKKKSSILLSTYCKEDIGMGKDDKNELVPVWEKATLTLEEAVAYSGIGRDKLCKLSNNEDCDFILWIGRKRLFKRKKLDEYIEKSFSI
jgi:excisionase family DNA binding protein